MRKGMGQTYFMLKSAWAKIHPEQDKAYAQISKQVQVGNDQEKAHLEKDSHSKNRGGKKPN